MKIIAHRGAPSFAPENTLIALSKALEYKVDGIEIDVRVTRDSIPILHHEPLVTDASGESYSVRQHTLHELQSHKADLATLSEVFASVDRRMPLIVEIKPHEQTKPIIDLIKMELRSQGPRDISIASFSWDILAEIQRKLPGVTLVVNERWSGVRATSRARRLGTRFICMRQQWLWPGFIYAMHKRGYQLSAYTLNDPAKARRWARSGLYAIVTDFPDKFISERVPQPSA